MKQRTLKESVSLEGVGIHTGEKAKILIHPEYENRGIAFLKKGVRVEATVENVVNTFMSTDLGKEGVVIKTVEHLMATFHLLGISNATVEVVEGSEIPILDGSAYEFYKALKPLVIKQSADAKVISVREPLKVSKGEAYLKALPCKCFQVTFEGMFKTPVGRQSFTFKGNVRDIILARTFCFEHDIDKIKESGLGKGGSLENTLVIGEEGAINKEGLRYKDEPARHKVLDLVGDLYLLGASVRGKFISFMGGHTLNYMLVKAIKESLERERSVHDPLVEALR